MKQQLLFIHGMWSRASVWDDWIGFFKQAGFDCHCIELPAHHCANNDANVQNQTLENYVNAVRQRISGMHRPILVGHSLGGLIAQQAAQYQQVSGIVLVNSAVPGQIFPIRPITLPGMVRIFSQWQGWKKATRLSRWEANYLVFNRTDKTERAELYDQMVAESGRVLYQVAFGRGNIRQTNRVNPKLVKCPILSFAGTQDRIIPIAVNRKLAGFYGPKLSHVEYPDAGHWLLGETNRQEICSQIQQWTQQLSQNPENRESQL